MDAYTSTLDHAATLLSALVQASPLFVDPRDGSKNKMK